MLGCGVNADEFLERSSALGFLSWISSESAVQVDDWVGLDSRR